MNKASVNLEATNLTQFVIDTTQSGEINQSITWVKVPKSVVGSKTKIRATDIVNGYNGIAFIKYDGEPTSVGDYTELSYGETALSNFNDYVCIGRRSGRTSRATFEFVD